MMKFTTLVCIAILVQGFSRASGSVEATSAESDDTAAAAPDSKATFSKAKKEYQTQVSLLIGKRWVKLVGEKKDQLKPNTKCEVAFHVSPSGKVTKVDLVTQNSLLLMAISIRTIYETHFPDFPEELRSEYPDGLDLTNIFKIEAEQGAAANP